MKYPVSISLALLITISSYGFSKPKPHKEVTSNKKYEMNQSSAVEMAGVDFQEMPKTAAKKLKKDDMYMELFKAGVARKAKTKLNA
jgi:hypothetical protein